MKVQRQPRPDPSFRSFLPESMRVLSGSTLKVFAVITMICDHVSLHILQHYRFAMHPFLGENVSLCTVMRIFGRLSFPIFAFLLTEGYRHTSDRRKYGLRLFMFALVSEIPWNLEHCDSVFMPSSQNVFFTLFFGYMGICLADSITDNAEGVPHPALHLILLTAVTVAVNADYGVAGFSFILLLYALGNRPALQAVTGCGVLNSKWIAGLAFFPINMYSGSRGFIRTQFAKLCFYLIYPVHIAVIWIVKKRLSLF